jgi:hypothetical protein
MATTKFDPFRKQGGTIELVRDANTGAYSTKTVGFASVPVINLPQLGVVEVTDDAAATKKKADEELQTQTASAFQAGGADDRDKDLDFTKLRIDTDEDRIDEAKKFSDAITKTSIENQEAQEEAAGIGIQEIKTPEVFMGEFAGTGPDRGSQDPTDVDIDEQDLMLRDAVIDEGATTVTLSKAELEKRSPKFLKSLFSEPKGIELARGRKPVEGVRPSERGALGFDPAFQQAQTQTRSDLPPPQKRSLGISAEPEMLGDTGASMDRMSGANLGIQKVDPTTKVASGFGVDPTAQTVNEQAAEEIKKKSSAGFPTGIKIAASLGSAVLGMLFGTKEDLSPTDQFKMGRFQTRGDLGSSTDPGRIVQRDSDGNRTVFDGFNRNSAFGNLGNSAQKRTDKVAGYAAKNRNKATELRRSAAGLPPGRKKDAALAKAAKYEAKAARQQEKADKYQEQVNNYKKDKPVQGTTKPGEDSGSTRDSGKIVCTMMNESYGFGSFRNKIWMKFHKDISPEYQKGYHKLFLPLVKYAKQKGITNKFIKNILEHIAVHSTIDMRQSLRGKRHLLGRVYRKIILPLCYWAGKK